MLSSQPFLETRVSLVSLRISASAGEAGARPTGHCGMVVKSQQLNIYNHYECIFPKCPSSWMYLIPTLVVMFCLTLSSRLHELV